jgi:hypothetical protein
MSYTSLCINLPLRNLEMDFLTEHRMAAVHRDYLSIKTAPAAGSSEINTV